MLDIMTKQEIATYLRISLSTLERYMARKDDPLPAFKLSPGRGSAGVRFRRVKVDEWLDRREARSTEPVG